jgi:TPR repeat protein
MKSILMALLLLATAVAQTVSQYTKAGDAAYLSKDYPKAVESYIQAIKLDPESPELYDKLGQVYRDQHNQRFIAAFKKAEELRAKRTGTVKPPAPAAAPSAALAAANEAYARKDYAAALKGFRPLANQGDAAAQFSLGLMYEEGEGVPKDLVWAYVWWTRAAAQHHAISASNVKALEAEMTAEQLRLARQRIAKP